MTETIQLGDDRDRGDAQGHQARPPLGASAERARDAGRAAGTRGWRSRVPTRSPSLAGFGSSRRSFAVQARETPRQFIERESHYLWGRRYLLTVVERDAKPFVSLDHRSITLTVRPGSSAAKRAEVMHEWHKSLLHEVVPALIRKWEPKLGVKVQGYFLQRMKTKWGSCNHRAGHIRLNTELVKKPRTCWSMSSSTRCCI